jgi:hypothetical protein
MNKKLISSAVCCVIDLLKKARYQYGSEPFFNEKPGGSCIIRAYRLIKQPAARLSATPAGRPASTLSSTWRR